MIIKKSTILLPTLNCFHSLSSSSAPISTTSSYTITTTTTTSTRPEACRPHGRQRLYLQHHDRRRHYATITSDSPNDASYLNWPDPPQGHTHPTPYQIFSLQHKEAYSKQRFYELVKLYHPDRNNGKPDTPSETAPSSHHHHHHHRSCNNSIPHATKLERYRLIVAAHAILSDPAKRRAYDSFGAGWAGTPDAGFHHHPRGRDGQHAPGPFSGWREHTDPNIWANATWEDWEKFHARTDPHHPANFQGGAHQGPVYLRNSYFVSLVVLMALLGSGANYKRGDSAGEKFLEARDAMHDRASRELRRVRQQSEDRPKEERIQFFLRQREATMLGISVEEVRQLKAEKLLPRRDTCMSEGLREKEWEGEGEGEKERG